jgi:hypothetical protein
MTSTHPRRARLSVPLAAFLLAMAGQVGAQDAPDPSSWLGLQPPAVVAAHGVPAEVFPLAVDDQRWQVVFFYPDHSYLYWTQNRVWQVRLDKLWTGTVQGLAMGASRADVEAALGAPLARGDNWGIWSLPHQAFPRKLRLIFTDGLLSDAYYYRSEL